MPATHPKASSKSTRGKSTRSAATGPGTGKKAPVSASDTASCSVASHSKPARAKLFQNGRSQAVRLPKEFRFEGKEVQVSRQGNSVVLTPLDTRSRKQYWDDYFKALEPYRDLPFPDCEDDSVTEPEDIFAEGWV